MSGPRIRARDRAGRRYYAAATPCDTKRGYQVGDFHPAVRIVHEDGTERLHTVYGLYCNTEAKARQAAVSYCLSDAADADGEPVS